MTESEIWTPDKEISAAVSTQQILTSLRRNNKVEKDHNAFPLFRKFQFIADEEIIVHKPTSLLVDLTSCFYVLELLLILEQHSACEKFLHKAKTLKRKT